MTNGTRVALRWLIYLAAAALIVLALLVGVLRLLLAQVPEYQDDIRAWASAATGYDIRFGRISASWPLSGPELSFYEVSLMRPGDAEPVLAARELAAGLSVLRLLRDGRPSLARIAVTGTAISIEHTEEGGLLVQGRRIEDLLPKPPRERTPELDVELKDVALTYLNPRLEPKPIALFLDHLEASFDRERMSADARLVPPARFGRELDVSVESPLPLPSPLALPASWDVRASGAGLDLPKVLSYAVGGAGVLRAAAGDATLELSVRERRAMRVAAEVALRNVVIRSGAEASSFDRFSGRLEWARNMAGWDASLSELRLRRGGRDAPPTNAEIHHLASGEAAPEQWRGRADFIRLDDVFPLAVAALSGTEFEANLPRLAGGDLRNVEVEFAPEAEEPSRYSLRLGFERLNVTTATGEVALAGLTGTIAADGDGGRLQLDSRDARLYLGQWFRDTLQAQTLKGMLIWRAGPDGVRVLSDDISLNAPDIDISSRLELAFPASPGSPIIDLKANLSATQAREALRYLPLRRFPPKVVDWLERAVAGGTVPRATVEVRGPVREFPYDHGEGTFRVALALQDATLDYAKGWPRIEHVDAEVVFDGIGMHSTTNRARIGGVNTQNYAVRVPDLRRGVLGLSGTQRTDVAELLSFVRATPVAEAIGPTLDRVTGAGPVDASLRLVLPLAHPADYELQVLFDARGCRLGLERVPVDLQELRGRILLQNTRFSGTGVRALMLGEPVEIDLRPEVAPDAPFTHVAEFTGDTPIETVASTFNLPFRQYFKGRTHWRATARIPARRAEAAVPLSLSIQTDLRGVTSALPPPVAKAADASWPATVDLAFAAADVIDVTGHLEPPLAWAMRLVSANGAWRIDRAALRAGPGEVRLPQRRGVELVGRVQRLRLADWLGTGGGDGRALSETWREASLQIDQLAVVGQVFPDVSATAHREADGWAVTVRGPRAEGTVRVPFDVTAKPLTLDMKRLWLLESEKGGDPASSTDPRKAIAVDVKAEDVAIGEWRFGRLEMSVARTPDGLAARRIATRAKSFEINGEGEWIVTGDDPARQRTRLKATLHGTDVRDTLQQLGFGPVIAGKEANASVDLSWPGGPSGDFLARASGQIGIELKNGQVLDLEPGSGRLLGLLSVTALPRRLALDFSDVLNQGLAFDSIKGNFRVASGNAYTCNLGLSGPVADIGIVGRTAFGERSYDQLAVVRPQVSNVLTVGGVVLGGPVGGATMLLISQLFRKPLSTLGESYYRVSGGWDHPEVLRVQRGEVNTVPFKDCEKEVNAALEATTIVAPSGAPTTAPPGTPR
jgi:uncharacterized protein (TIGR02099 family)